MDYITVTPEQRAKYDKELTQQGDYVPTEEDKASYARIRVQEDANKAKAKAEWDDYVHNDPNPQRCPICKTIIARDKKHHKMLCEACAKKTTDKNGRAVEFSFQTGGMYDLEGRYAGADPQEKYEGLSCYVDGHACKVIEMHYATDAFVWFIVELAE